MGGAAAGVKFYAAYPMSPSTGVLMWMAAHARQLGIMVRQVEDEIGVMNMVIGAAHTGCRAMCATSGGGFALDDEAIGMAGMIETPVVCVDVQRAGPATGVPTKTEQGDLWQVLGAAREIILGSWSHRRISSTCSTRFPNYLIFATNINARAWFFPTCLSRREQRALTPMSLDFDVKIDRGELILPNGNRSGSNAASGYNDKAYLVSRLPRAGFHRAPFLVFLAHLYRRHR